MVSESIEQGATTIVITSGELCKSMRDSGRSTKACCEAMQAEVKPGDAVLVSASGAGMTVRNRLPRMAQQNRPDGGYRAGLAWAGSGESSFVHTISRRFRSACANSIR